MNCHLNFIEEKVDCFIKLLFDVDETLGLNLNGCLLRTTPIPLTGFTF